MRRNIEFNADGLTLRGWLYLPEGATKPVPTVVMAHGFSCLKEMFLDKYAETFAAAGFGVLVYDNRNFGDSDGMPRQEVDPWGQIHDYRHAITYASTLPEVDADRIGIWGTSYTGGHVLIAAAIDKRVKCVVSQVPVISGYRNAHRAIAEDRIPQVQALFAVGTTCRRSSQSGAPALRCGREGAGEGALPWVPGALPRWPAPANDWVPVHITVSRVELADAGLERPGGSVS
jgi:uncharacterized protein